MTGDITGVHDPSMCVVDGTYYLYGTGIGLPIWTSTDRTAWVVRGLVLSYSRTTLKLCHRLQDLFSLVAHPVRQTHTLAQVVQHPVSGPLIALIVSALVKMRFIVADEMCILNRRWNVLCLLRRIVIWL